MKRIVIILMCFFVTQAFAQAPISRKPANIAKKESAKVKTAKTKTVVKNKTDVDDLVELGFNYFFGTGGVTIDKEKGVDYLKKAAAMNNTEAMILLGDFYSTPNSGIPTDLQAAITWYTKAANLGDVDAMVELGEMYRDGEGCTQNVQKANELFLRAAKKNDGLAFYNLGLAYAYGIGVTKNINSSITYFQKAIGEECFAAYLELGDCYMRGEGIETNYEEAFKCYSIMSQKVSIDAKPELYYRIGFMLGNGYGCQQDKAQALQIYKQLKQLGYEVESGVNYPILDDKKTFTVNGVSFNMIPVEGGTFYMGATQEQSHPSKDELPIHKVTLSSYLIGETEVTQELWQTVMDKNPSPDKHPQKPVYRISWKDCQIFISKLDSLTGMKFRLPTEAEWEFAARGGNKSTHYTYSGSNDVNDVAWYGYNLYAPEPVASKHPNELGIYDMSGNIAEWCSDDYEPYKDEEQINPNVINKEKQKILRGGTYRSNLDNMHLSHRECREKKYHLYPSGLRLVLSE